MSIKFYELIRRSLEKVLPPLYRNVRLKLLENIEKSPNLPSILDVGGRKSPYTIGIPAKITIIDLPRETEIQKTLNLGLNEEIIEQLKRRRSNIENFVFGDMTKCDFPDNSFDYVISVEVLEHVEKDEEFIKEVFRVLKPNGKFLMSTPNGDFVENKNPDHKRHYKNQQLKALLEKKFKDVRVEYAIEGGYYRKLGLKSWSIKKPGQTILSMYGNFINSIQSSKKNIEEKAIGTHHLIAIAQK